MDTFINLGGNIVLAMIVLVNFAIKVRISVCSKSTISSILYFESGIEFSFLEWCKIQPLMHEWRTDQIGTLYNDQQWCIFVPSPGSVTFKFYNEAITLNSSQFQSLLGTNAKLNAWYEYYIESGVNYN
jgi:hypothetical protein